MKAAVVTDKGVQYTDAPKPAPKAGEILIKVKAASLNRADLAVASGHAHGRIGGRPNMVDPGACWPSGDLLVVGCPMVQEGTAGITLLEALPSAWFFQLRAAISSVCLCGSNYFRVAAFYPERNRPDVGSGDCAGMA